MAILEWDKEGERIYETGVEKGVLYPVKTGGTYDKGVAWNGLITVAEKPSGAEASPIYADNIKYLSLISNENFAASIQAYTYPDEFKECDGSAALTNGVYINQQPRKGFGLAYRTVVGNDSESNEYGYKIHLIYGCKASPSEKSYNTINDNPDAIQFSWEISTTPVNVKKHKPTAMVIIDSTKIAKEKMKSLEDILYGTDTTEARLPLPDEVLTIIGAAG